MRSVLLLVLIGCGSPGPSSTKDGVTVDLASVTLADDCGDHGYIPPPTVVADKSDAKVDPASKEPMAERAASQPYCPPGAPCNNAVSHARGCSQTSMQLSFKAGAATTVKVTKVELLDESQKTIGTLASRLPKRWDSSKYIAWNEQLGANERVATSYALAAPNWEDMGGRFKAQAKKYQLRVTINVGDAEHVVEKQSISPVVMQPDVMTRR
jgi:hypothetical protein